MKAILWLPIFLVLGLFYYLIELITDTKKTQSIEPITSEDYKKLAKQGDADAMYQIALLSDENDDVDDAITWYKKASQVGNTMAISTLIDGYLDGFIDVDGKPRKNPNPQESLKWLIIGHQLGDFSDIPLEEYLTSFEESYSMVDKVVAKKKAEEWLTKYRKKFTDN